MNVMFIVFLVLCPFLGLSAPPDPPSIRLYHYDTTRIVLIWDPPANNGGSGITSCHVYMKFGEGSYSQIATLDFSSAIATLTSFNGQPLQVGIYSIYATAINADGTSQPSPITIINLAIPTAPDRSSVVNPPAEVARNTQFTITIQTYDVAGNMKTTGGDYVVIVVSDVCRLDGQTYRCLRVGSGDGHYNPDILPQRIYRDLIDNGDGTYTTTLSIPQAGYVSVFPAIYRQGGIRCDVFFADCGAPSLNYQGYYALSQVTPRLGWATAGDFPGGRNCMYTYMFARIRPPASADYTFYCSHDDDYHFWINGNTIISSLCCPFVTGSFHMEKHGIYDVFMQFNEQGGGALLFLDWSAAGYFGQNNVPPEFWWYPEKIGGGIFDIKVNAPPAPNLCYITGLISGSSVSEDTLHSVQITTVWDVAAAFRIMPDTYEIKIIGPSPLTTETVYNPIDLGNFIYRFDYTLADPGQYQLSIKIGGQHIQNSPLSFTVYPCHPYCVGCTGTLNTQCIACNPAEKAYPAPGVATTCDICHPGFRADLNIGLCVACDIGEYQDLEKQESCKKCETGTYQPAQGQSSCILCPVGKVQPDIGQTICNDCLVGEYMPEEGKTLCLPCPQGKFNVMTGKSVCTDCIAGEYQNVEGKTSCIPCAAGTYSPTPGYVECLPCELGKYQDLEGKTACVQCSPGYYSPSTGAANCQFCPEGTYTDTFGAFECKTCPNGWYPNVNRNTCLYKGIFDTQQAYLAHPMATACFDSNAKIIKPYTPACRAAYHTICCTGSTKSTLIDCNYGLESLSDSMRDKYCSACTFMDQTQCPTDGLCWNDSTWTDNNVSPNPATFSPICLNTISPYCGKRLNANLNDPECGQIVGSCLGKITSSAYVGWNKFRITFDKAIPSLLPDCNQIFNFTSTPIANMGTLACTKFSDFAFDVTVSKLPGPMNNYTLRENYLTDACGIYLQGISTQSVTPPNPPTEALMLTGSSNDKCKGLNIKTFLNKPYPWPMQDYTWNAIYSDSSVPPADTLERLSKIGNFNMTNITVRDYDLFPDKQMAFKAQILTPFNTYLNTPYYNVTVPKIASGKKYCGPCQFNDRSKCGLFNGVCWIDYMNYTVIDPLNTTDCLKAMAPICYQIWLTTSIDDSQCLDFVKYFNFQSMRIKPAPAAASYSADGKIIKLEFRQAIRQSDWADCSNAFETDTINWLPDAKSCKWTSTKVLEIDYEPQKGIMEKLTIKSNAFYYDYLYAQNPADKETLSIKLPPVNATLKINGISAVSECDTVELFGTIVTPSLYPLALKWEVKFDPPLTEPRLSEANTLLAPLNVFGKISAISIPSKVLKQGSKINVTLSAKAASFDSNIIATSTVVNVFGNIPKIKFTSKSQFVVELNGNKSTSIPILIDNAKCAEGGSDTSTAELIPIDVSFSISSGDTKEIITTKGEDELNIEKTLLSGYSKLKSVFVGNKFGFKYLKYYNLTAIVTSTDDGTKNSDSIILFFEKPPIKSVIDSPGTLVSINADVQINGTNSEFPALETDTKSYLWKCISAQAMEVGGTCECPILTETSLKAANLIISKDKLVNMCKYKFSLTVKATQGTYSRTAYNESEFMTFKGPAASMKAKLIEGSNTEVKDMYLTFGTDGDLASGEYKWALAEVESQNPQVQEKYSERNTFIYDFFKNELKANPDPTMKTGDVTIPNGRRRKLADVTPNYLTPTTTRVLGIDKSGLLPEYKYTFAVTVYSGSTPTFLFIQFTMPPAPRPRVFSVEPTTGVAFSTSFGFTFTLPSTTDVDEAYYQLFRKDCPGSENAVTAMTQKFSNSNSYKTVVGPGLKTCDNKVEIILRIYEYNSFIDVTTTITVNEPSIPVDQVLSQQTQALNGNDLTMDQKLSIMAAVSNVPVTDASPESNSTTTVIIAQIDTLDKPGGILEMLEPKEQAALLGTATETLGNLVMNQAPNIDLNTASSVTGKVDDYITAVKTKEGGTYLIPTALAALSNVADIGTTQQSEAKFFSAMQNAMNKMTDMKLAEMVPGSAPYTLTSPSIGMIVAKNTADDYNKTKNFNTKSGVNIQMPDGIANQMINSMNATPNGSVTFGASIYTTSFNPFTNIKNATKISMSSLSPASLNGFFNTTIQRIYEDMSKGMLGNVVNKREQAADLVQLSFKPYQLNNDASEKQINASVQVGDLPPGKEAVFSIPAPKNTSANANETIMVPLYYVPEKDVWSNENCSLDQRAANSTSLVLRCNHMGKGKITSVNQGFTVTVDVIKDVFNVIRAGNYQQLANLNALLEVNDRAIAAYCIVLTIGTVIVIIVVMLIKKDKEDIYQVKLNCLFKIFCPKSNKASANLLDKILKFFSQLRKKGMQNVTKKNQRTVVHHRKSQPSIDQRLKPIQSSENIKKKSNGFSKLSRDDKNELQDAYNMYKQCSLLYNEQDLFEIMNAEFENKNVLNRITQVYIDDLILLEPASFWIMMKNENQVFNALLKPEITTPRPLKFLVFTSVILGQLFVTGFFFNPEEKTSISDNASQFVNTALVYSLAATLLMIPLKIIISLFMTGKPLTEDMTREQIEAAERTRPLFKTIGLVLGFAWIIFCLYSIMMYIISFTQIALDNWMTTYGISMFTELFIVAQLKVLLKVVIGLLLMQIAQTKSMLSTAGIIAGYAIDFIMRLV